MQKYFLSNKGEIIILSILFLGLVIASSTPEYTVIGASITLIPGIAYSIVMYPKITKRYLKGRWQILLFMFSIIAFYGTILAEKELNSQYFIDISYLKNSPIIIGSFYSLICTVAIILMLASTALMAKLLFFSLFSYVFKKYKKSAFKSGLEIFIPTIPLLILGFLLEILPENLLSIVILSDAYAYSDCISKENSNTEYLFIRKSDNECYQISNHEISITPLQWAPVYSIIKSEKS